MIPIDLLLDLVRGLTASTPPPRGLPYLGLEHASGTGFHLLDALSARGIFRKYELVLDVGAGLGGRARWLATRFGCEVVGATLTVEEAAGGTQLGRRSGLRAQVRLLPAAPQALPFRAARFTHVWLVESLSRLPDAQAALAEAYRVVRPGGWLAVQDLFRTGRARAEVPGWRFADPEVYVEAIAQRCGSNRPFISRYMFPVIIGCWLVFSYQFTGAVPPLQAHEPTAYTEIPFAAPK